MRAITACWMVVLAGAVTVPAQAQTDSLWTPERSARIRTIGSLELAPDGRQVAFVVTTTVLDDGAGRYTRHLWIAATDGSGARVLVPSDSGAGSPAWTPDGRRITYMSSRGGGAPALWSLDPTTGEGYQVTSLSSPIASYKWSPDGRQLAVTMADPPSPERIAAMTLRDLRVIDTTLAVSVNIHVLRIDSTGRAVEPRRLTQVYGVVLGYDWAPDGSAIAYSVMPGAAPANLVDTDVHVVDVRTGRSRDVVRQPGFDTQPVFTPDGRSILFATAMGDTSRAMHRYHTDFGMVPAVGGPVRYLPLTPRRLGSFREWAADGRSFYYVESIGTSQAFYAMPLDGGKPTEIFRPESGVLNSVAMLPDGQGFIYANEAPDRPVEVYARQPSGATIRLTNLNVAVAASAPYGRTELIRWKGPSGDELEGLLTYPVGYERGRRYPMLVYGHAGLYHHTQDHSARFTAFALQWYAGLGYAVFRPNPRGSNNQTLAFREAITRDWGGTTYADNISGIDRVIALGVADPERVGVMGWSTGGYMTATLISRTNRFKAAVAGAAPVDLVSFTTTTDDVDWLPTMFGAFPWEDDREYRRQSPLFHMKNVRTPTLVLAGEDDQRVPVAQSWALYNTLRLQGTTTRLAIVPRMGHGPSTPAQLATLARETVAWFTRHIPPR